MIGLAAVSAIAASAAGNLPFALGLILGAALAILNYFWLHQAIERLLSTEREQLPWLVVAKFALRYPLAFGGIYLLYRTGWLPVAGLLCGLFIPVAGVLIEAVVQIRAGWRTP